MSSHAKNPYREMEQTKAPEPKSGELVYRPQGRTDRFAGGNWGFRMFAPAVVVGTYAPAENFVHVNLKVVAADTQLVLAAADYGLPLDNNTKTLLRSGR